MFPDYVTNMQQTLASDHPNFWVKQAVTLSPLPPNAVALQYTPMATILGKSSSKTMVSHSYLLQSDNLLVRELLFHTNGLHIFKMAKSILFTESTDGTRTFLGSNKKRDYCCCYYY